jgi:hypothetical protein
VWKQISDLAGAALADLRRRSLGNVVREYLTRLYTEDLRAVEPISTIPLPAAERNLTNLVSEPDLHLAPYDGPYGTMLALGRYDPPIVIPVHRSVSPTSRAQVVMRAPDGPEHVSLYFRVWYTNRKRDPAAIYVGTTTHRRDAWITRRERQIPAQMLTPEWTNLVVQLSDLFRRGSVLGTSPPYYLEKIWFRVGHRIQPESELTTIQVAFVGVYGFDD